MMAARVGRLKVFYALAARGEEKNRQKNMRRATFKFSKNAVKLSHVKYLRKLTVELED
jgi:hypothetical protein